jgi:serine/threonine-protein kinase
MLGQGAMGAVWKAENTGTGDLVAIKILVEHLAKSWDFIKRFEREAEAMRVIDHKGVVRFKEYGSNEGLYYIVMEYVDGEPIRREMEHTKVPPPRGVAICRRVARGLHAAHMAGVVHRDLKPENILLSRAGELKIVDFGLAGMAEDVDPHHNLTRSRVTMGTMNYMAPEQRVDAKRVDRRADIYSLGVILYEMFTRELPIGRFTLPYERGCVGVPPLADQILRKALANEKEKRHQSAADLDVELAELERVIQSGAVQDATPSRKRHWPFA